MNIARIEDRLVVISASQGLAAYDFDFELHFRCTHPPSFEPGERCVFRLGPLPNYEAEYAEKRSWGLEPVHTPAQHRLASERGEWYPLLSDLTPRSEVYERPPSAEEVEATFGWPLFLKGSRQTSRHNPELSVIADRAHYERAVIAYGRDPILHWQRPVVREYVHLVRVAGRVSGKVPAALEYRSFWWHGACVGWGRYWFQVPPYDTDDREAGLAAAQAAALRLALPFLVVDVAKARDGRWLVIECNDAQEAGYAAIPPRRLWQNVLDRLP